MGLGIVGILLLLVSCATAVPTTQSTPVMQQIEKKDTTEALLKSLYTTDAEPLDGILDLLIQLITVIVQLVMEIIAIVQGILGIISLIQTLINALQTLFTLITQLIEIISGLFNPSQQMM